MNEKTRPKNATVAQMPWQDKFACTVEQRVQSDLCSFDRSFFGWQKRFFKKQEDMMKWNDGRCRCAWANPTNEKYIAYHDNEWGVPKHDDRDLFELLILESFQAGLSWECILNKRDAFVQAFDHFDLDAVCAYDDKKKEELRENAGIVRNRLKINAAVKNAKVFREIQKEYGTFDAYLWHWTKGEVIVEIGKASSPLSNQISKDLKKRGMSFVGTTIIYAYLQATGVIHSHEEGCYLHQNIKVDNQ